VCGRSRQVTSEGLGQEWPTPNCWKDGKGEEEGKEEE